MTACLLYPTSAAICRHTSAMSSSVDAAIDQHRRGGRHQRRAQAEAAASALPTAMPDNGSKGQLAMALLNMWAWGDLSATKLQQLAACSKADGFQCTALLKLATLGSAGKHPQNCQRDLLQWLGSYMQPAMPEVYIAPVPLVLSKHRPGVHRLDLPFLPLHRTFSHIYHHFPAQWKQCIAGEDSVIEEFWASVSPDDPKWNAWQDALGDKELLHAVPFALHGDGVPVFKGKSLEVTSANSLLGRGSTLDLKLLMGCYWHQCRSKGPGQDTEDTMWHVYQWDLNALWSGKHPPADHNGTPWPPNSAEASIAGTPLAGGFFGVPWVFRGDLDYLANALGLEHYGSHTPCALCQADRSQRPWADFRAGSAWKATVWSDTAWRVAHPQPHRLFKTLQCGVHTVQVDTLHCISLGVAQHIGGNVLRELLYTVLRTGSLQDRLQRVWHMVQRYYREHRVAQQVSKLTLSMFLQKAPRQHYPELKTKAKETEYLACALAWVWPQLADVNIAHNALVHGLLQTLVNIYGACKQPGLFLSEPALAQLHTDIDLLLGAYTALGNAAAANGQRLWNVTPKFHYLWHWGQQARWLHPRATATYMDEDFVGRIAHTAKACTGGVSIARLGNIVLAKYRRGLFLRWSRLDNAGALRR